MPEPKLKFNVQVQVQGRPNSGKTTVAMIIERALKAFGIEVAGDVKVMTFPGGETFLDMTQENYEKRLKKLDDEEFKKSFSAGRKVTLTQRAQARTGSFLDNDVQFPRLLAEIRAVGLTDGQVKALETSMDLSVDRIDEILSRAEDVFEKIKDGRE